MTLVAATSKKLKDGLLDAAAAYDSVTMVWHHQLGQWTASVVKGSLTRTANGNSPGEALQAALGL